MSNTLEPRAMAGNIPVYCAHDEILPLDNLITNPRNPNTHPAEQITLLTKIIENQGWRSPIVVSRRSGYITKGHGRLMAAYEGNMMYAPVDYQNYDSEEEEYADMMADNRIAELSEMDEDILHELLSELADTDIDLALTGYDGEELDRLLEGVAEELEEEEEEEAEEEPSKELPRVPMSQPFDEWILGCHKIEVGDTNGDDLLIVDVMVGAYIEHTGNISAICVREGRQIPYMDMIRNWAELNDCVHILAEQKVPVLKFKK